MFEYPNVVGSLDADGVRDLARSLGFRAEEVRAIGEAKHIFSHVEWHMRGYEVTGVPEDDCELSLYRCEHILSALAVPSAFGYFTGRLRDAQTAQL